jgi:hypothetical protein
LVRSRSENSCCTRACRDEALGSHLAAEVGFDNFRNRLVTEGEDYCIRRVLHSVAAGYTGERCSLEGGKVEANSKEDTRFGCSPDYSSEKDMVVEIVREDSHYSQHVAERRSRPAQGTKTSPWEGCDSQVDEVSQVFRRRG